MILGIFYLENQSFRNFFLSENLKFSNKNVGCVKYLNFWPFGQLKGQNGQFLGPTKNVIFFKNFRKILNLTKIIRPKVIYIEKFSFKNSEKILKIV
jgi:hypothetical protein